MGLTTWADSPDGRILKSDVTIAKNYLNEQEVRRLDRSISGFFDYVEGLIEDEMLVNLQDFSLSIDEFLTFRRYKIRDGKGSISKIDAEYKARLEYDSYNKTQKINSDFEKTLTSLDPTVNNK